MPHPTSIPLAMALAATATFARPPEKRPAPSFELEAPKEISPSRAAAVKALALFTAEIIQRGSLPPGFPPVVQNPEQMKHARIGWGFEVYEPHPISLEAGLTLEAAANPVGSWRYAVILQGHPIFLMTLAPTAEGWQMVSMGGTGLGEEIGALLPRFEGQTGTKLRFIRVPQAMADFIEVKEGDQPARYLPLRAARMSLQIEQPEGIQAEPLEASAILPHLRQAVARALTHSR